MSQALYGGYVTATERRYGIPRGLMTAAVMQESGFNPEAVSPAGARGIAQFMPATAASMGVDPDDPVSSIDGMGRYLKAMYARYGDWSLAVAAYNAGPGAVDRYGGIPPFEETQSYVRNIMGGKPAKVPRYLASATTKAREELASRASAGGAAMPETIFRNDQQQTAGAQRAGGGGSLDIAGGADIATLVATIAQMMAGNNLNAYGQIGALDPAFFGGADPNTFLPTLPAKIADANIQNQRAGLLAGLRGPKDAIGYQYLLSGLAAPQGTQVNPYRSILEQSSPAQRAAQAANPNLAADQARGQAMADAINAQYRASQSAAAAGVANAGPQSAAQTATVAAPARPSDGGLQVPTAAAAQIYDEQMRAAEQAYGGTGYSLGAQAPAGSGLLSGSGQTATATMPAAPAAAADGGGGMGPSTNDDGSVTPYMPDPNSRYDPSTGTMYQQTPWGDPALEGMSHGGLLGGGNQTQAIVGDHPSGMPTGMEERVKLLPPKNGKSRAKVEPLSYEKDPVEVAIKMPVRALKMAMGGIFGGDDPISTTVHTPETIGNMPAVRQIKGEQQTPEFQGFDTGSNPAMGLTGLPSIPNYGKLQKMRPSSRDVLSSVYEQGLGVDFRDIVAQAAAATPVGQRYAPAMYGG